MISESALITMIRACAKMMQVNPDLAVAIAQNETDLDTTKCRYEPAWNYLVNVDRFAQKLGITSRTEEMLQKFSWGIMQVMGSVLRELGYNGPLNESGELNLAMYYGCKKLSLLSKKYPQENDVISAYNAGTPIKDSDGKYRNQEYVNNVLENLKKLRA
jgi:soluble lytic murein transglycosylase-like protein